MCVCVCGVGDVPHFETLECVGWRSSYFEPLEYVGDLPYFETREWVGGRGAFLF